MVIEWFLDALAAVVTPVIELLPQGNLPLPDPAGITLYMRQLDSFVPVLPLFAITLALLSVTAYFVTLRLVLLVRYVLLP